MTLTNKDFQSAHEHEKTIIPGYGCYMQLDRVANGSWGEIEINVPDAVDHKSLLVFDDDDDATGSFDVNSQFSGLLKGMMYSDDGWLKKKLFVANRDNSASGRAATFKYRYTNAVSLKYA